MKKSSKYRNSLPNAPDKEQKELRRKSKKLDKYIQLMKVEDEGVD